MFLWNFSIGQSYNLANNFTINDGLPSNHIYEMIEDNSGFLWISTDNGISRFDGKRFINYTTKNGLPSNDVIQIKKEKDGTIWVNCYKQPPSYFNEKLNRFISFENNKQIVKNSFSLLYPICNPNGGIYFSNNNGTMFFKNKKLEKISNDLYNNLYFNNEQYKVDVVRENDKINQSKHSVLLKNNKIIGKFDIGNRENTILLLIQNNVIFQLFRNKFDITKINQIKPFNSSKKTLSFKENLKWFSISNDEIGLITNSGKILVYDIKNIKLTNEIHTNKEVNYYYKDKNETIWIATLNDGLLNYKKSKIKVINPLNQINTNFLSVHVNNENTIFSGNFQGEILEKNQKIITHKSNVVKNTVWIRAISTFKNQIITVSDLGYCINYGKIIAIQNKEKHNVSLKTAEKLNDSILIIGSSDGLYKLNVLKNKYNFLGFKTERILSINKIDENEFYFTANSGIFKYNFYSKKQTLIFSNSSLINENIQNITKSKIGDLWFTTFKGNLFLVKNGKIKFSILNSDKLPINSTKIIEIDNQLWIASKEGIYVVDISNLPKYAIKNISTFDGLSSNVINSICENNDTIYAATSKGISVIPKNLKFTKFEIFPTVISISINNQIEPLKSNYNLAKDQKNVIIQLSGIELSGHFKKFQYSINNEENWIDLEGNTLNLSLKGGENNIIIRAVDVNSNISSKKMVLNFNVAIPFYNTIWFWIVFAFAFAGILFWVFNRQKFANQKRNFEQKLALEQQRSKITADLHDDIGATLSSLQINSAVANKLLDKNPKEAQKVLEKIENQSQNLADKIGDIIWSMKPGKDEFMTMSTRIKNFANEILGSTDIQYKINIDKNIDVLITDITVRKNIVLITKEAINNAIKYSKASKLEVKMTLENSNIQLSVKDNGIGFNIKEIKGNGIANMQKRTEELNGKFEINSSLEDGTTISVIIPFVT